MPEPDGTGRERPERIGLLGGTFDPPHVGHLEAALCCREVLGLDRVLLVVANHPWQKVPGRAISPAADRLAMVEGAVDGLEGIEASRLEIDRGGPSYTIDTVEELLGRARGLERPLPELFLVVGADLVDGLGTWERVDDLRRLVTLVVVSRPHSPAPEPPPGWRAVVVEGPGIDVSSSQVRAMVAERQSLKGVVPGPVIRCIQRRDLYAVPR